MADKKQKPSIFFELDEKFLKDIYDKGFAKEMAKRAGVQYPDPLSYRTLDKLAQSAQGNMKKAVKEAGFSGKPRILPAQRTESGQRAVRMQYHPNDIYGYVPVQRRPYKAPARRMSGKTSGMMSMGAGMGIGQMLRGMMNKEQPKR